MPVRLPEAWADVATKNDLRDFEERLTLRMDTMEERLLKRIEREATSLYRTMVVTTIGAVVTVGAFAFAAAGLV